MEQMCNTIDKLLPKFYSSSREMLSNETFAESMELNTA